MGSGIYGFFQGPDLSFPKNDLNFTSVNINNFRCDWGTFNEVRNIVINAPEGSEAATLDVDSAFRCCPITPSQQCNFIVHWVGSFYIDHNAPFGATSSGGVFGRIANTKSAILESKSLSPSKNWVDNFVFFRFLLSIDSGLPSFLYSLSDITILQRVSDGHGNFPRRDPLPLSSST